MALAFESLIPGVIGTVHDLVYNADVTFGLVTARALYLQPSVQQYAGMEVTEEYSIRFRVADMVLAHGNTVTVTYLGVTSTFRVRDVTYTMSGAEMIAKLSKV